LRASDRLDKCDADSQGPNNIYENDGLRTKQIFDPVRILSFSLSRFVCRQIKNEGALPIIPNRCTALKKIYCSKRLYRRRHKIESFFCPIKD
jgi:hypothetical protein